MYSLSMLSYCYYSSWVKFLLVSTFICKEVSFVRLPGKIICVLCVSFLWYFCLVPLRKWSVHSGTRDGPTTYRSFGGVGSSLRTLSSKGSRESSSVETTMDLEPEGRGLYILLFKDNKFGEPNTIKQYRWDRLIMLSFYFIIYICNLFFSILMDKIFYYVNL